MYWIDIPHWGFFIVPLNGWEMHDAISVADGVL